MEAWILLGTFLTLCALSVPIAYSLGLAAIVAAVWTDIPLEAIMLKMSDGTDDFALLAIPFFVLAGGIMAEGGMALRLVNLARRVRRLHPRRTCARQRAGQHDVRGHFRILGRRHGVDRVGDDPADGQGRVPAGFRDQRHHLRLGAGAADPPDRTTR